jgi:drug/metabolite transporter (DMT)-like permease
MAIGGILAARVFSARPVSPPTLRTFISNVPGTVAMIVGTLAFDSPLRLPSTAITWLAVIALGLTSWFGFLLLFWLFDHVGATRTMLITYCAPLVGVTLGVLVLHEPFTWNLGAGGALIFVALLLFRQ